MSKITIILLLCLCGFKSLAQDIDFDKQLGTDYADFDLSKYIKTKYDFDQSKMTVEEIDEKIKQIIESQTDKNLLELEVPINYKKVTFLGNIYPAETNLFQYKKADIEIHDSCLKKKSYIYKYNNIYISSSKNTLLDRYFVYYTIRAYLIIKYRFKYINEILINNTELMPINFLSPVPEYININKNYFVSFDRDKPRPSSIQYLGPIEVNHLNTADSVDVYNNTEVMYFNRATIRNGGVNNSIAIYKDITTPEDKVGYYMKDGFIHSFIHERIHDFISSYKNVNNICYTLRSGCVEQGIVKDRYPFEEVVVNNTVNILFDMLPNRGGLSKEVLLYYDELFAQDLQSFKKDKSYKKLWDLLLPYYNENSLKKYSSSKIFNDNIVARIFFLNFEHPDNIPVGPKPALLPNTTQPQKEPFNLKAYKKQIEQRK